MANKKPRLLRAWKRVWDSNTTYYMIRMPLFKALDCIAGRALERARFKRAHGYPLKLENPESFNEKLTWKKHFDRNPLLPVTADKLRARKYIEVLLGKERAAEILIPLLYATDRPETIPFDRLPRSFALKANHSCGMNYFVRDLAREDIQKLIKLCRRWLRRSYGVFNYQWAYQDIPRRIIVEELLPPENLMYEYRFFMIHGQCQVVLLEIDTSGDWRRNIYDRDWNQIDLFIKHPRGGQISKPANYEKMLRLAEDLSRDFDQVRVDLYSHEGKIYFGELTNYSGAGLSRWEPKSRDFETGSHWIINEHYWKDNPRAKDISLYGSGR